MKKMIIYFAALAALSIAIFAYTTDGATQSAQSAQTDLIEFPLPEGEEAYAGIDGKKMWEYVVEQAKISTDYRDSGHPQYWGRIPGTSGDSASAEWLMDKYRAMGMTDVHAQTVNLFLPQWAPTSWSVTLEGGGKTVPLVSAFPSYGSPATNGRDLDVEVVYVGLGSEADYVGRDVRGKAVLVVIGQLLHNVGSPDVRKRAMAKGAAALIGMEIRDGNHVMAPYPAGTNIPTFHLGTQDGVAVRDLIGSGARPHLRIRLDADWVSGQKSYIVWGTLPGATDENIYVETHRDGWFEAAGDNGSGIAVMLGLAEHYSKIPQAQRRRTMIFLGTDGHHNRQALGNDWLKENRERIFPKAALMIHPEHPAQVLTMGDVGIDRANALGSVLSVVTTTVTAPAGWSDGGPSRPKLNRIVADAFHRFGVAVTSEPRAGEGAFGMATVTLQDNDYHDMHTLADVPATVSWTGLQSATRALAKIIDEVNELPLSDLERPAPPPAPGGRPSVIPDHCTEWLEDSAASCDPGDAWKNLPPM